LVAWPKLVREIIMKKNKTGIRFAEMRNNTIMVKSLLDLGYYKFTVIQTMLHLN
jgi:hypothetical protein